DVPVRRWRLRLHQPRRLERAAHGHRRARLRAGQTEGRAHLQGGLSVPEHGRADRGRLLSLLSLLRLAVLLPRVHAGLDGGDPPQGDPPQDAAKPRRRRGRQHRRAFSPRHAPPLPGFEFPLPADLRAMTDPTMTVKTDPSRSMKYISRIAGLVLAAA